MTKEGIIGSQSKISSEMAIVPKSPSEKPEHSKCDALESTSGWMFTESTAGRHNNQRANIRPRTQNGALHSNHNEGRARLKIP